MCQEDWNLHLAVKENRLDIARALIARGDDFDTRDKDGRTPLYWAVQETSLDVVRLLIEHGVDVNGSIRKKMWRWDLYPLQVATWGNSLDLVRLVIEHGADLNRVDPRSLDHGKNRTPLLHALDRRSFDVARFLIEHGADINTVSYTHLTLPTSDLV